MAIRCCPETAVSEIFTTGKGGDQVMSWAVSEIFTTGKGGDQVMS